MAKIRKGREFLNSHRHKYIPLEQQPNRLLTWMRSFRDHQTSRVQAKLMADAFGKSPSAGLIERSLSTIPREKFKPFEEEARWDMQTEESVMNAIAECIDNLYHLFLNTHSESVREQGSFKTLAEVSPFGLGRLISRMVLSTNPDITLDFNKGRTVHEDFYRAVFWGFISLVSPLDYIEMFDNPKFNPQRTNGSAPRGPVEAMGRNIALVQKETHQMGRLLQLWGESKLFHTLTEITDMIAKHPNEPSFLYHFSNLIKDEISIFHAVAGEEVSTSHFHTFLRDTGRVTKEETDGMMRRSIVTQGIVLIPVANDLDDIVSELAHCRLLLRRSPALKANFLRVSRAIYEALPSTGDYDFYKMFLLSLLDTQQDIEKHEELVALIMNDDPAISLVLQKALQRGVIQQRSQDPEAVSFDGEGFDGAFSQFENGEGK